MIMIHTEDSSIVISVRKKPSETNSVKFASKIHWLSKFTNCW